MNKSILAIVAAFGFASALAHWPRPSEVITCAPITRCSCMYLNGIIDLHPLANNDGTPRFRDIPDPDGKTFYSWNPCYDFNETSCANVAVAKIENQGSKCTSLGNQASVLSVSSSDTGFQYQYTNWHGQNLSANVIMTCDLNENGTLIRRKDLDYYHHVFLELRSKYICPVASNVSTTPHTTVSTGRPRPRITPVFIGPGKTIFPPTTTEKPIFDQTLLGGLLIAVLCLLLFVLLLLAGLFFFVHSRLNPATAGFARYPDVTVEPINGKF